MKRFFKPFEGEHYKEGIQGKRILVVGASCYCSKKEECKYFSECTNSEKKDSSKFDDDCPDYKGKKTKLSDEPTTIISQDYPAPHNFALFIQKFVGEEDTWTTWKRMAYTEYLQFISPTSKTCGSYLSERDFKAFEETIIELQPHIIVVWGKTIIKDIRIRGEKNTYIYDCEELKDTNNYICHMKVPGVNHNITLVNCYHPSDIYRHWSNNLPDFTKYMQIALDE